MEVIVQIYRSWALKINKVYLDITNILVVLLKICQIEVFNITNTQYNKQISPAHWHFVKSVFHYMSSLLFFQLQVKGSTPKWHVIWAYIKNESHSFKPIIVSCRGTAQKYTGNLSHHAYTVNLCFPLQLEKISWQLKTTFNEWVYSVS